MTMRVLAAALMLSMAGACAAEPSYPWLYGRWVLSENPDGSPPDWLEFQPGGRAATGTEGGPRWTGGYQVEGDIVKMVFLFRDRYVPASVRISGDRRSLLHRSDSTGNLSRYTRLPESAGAQ